MAFYFINFLLKFYFAAPGNSPAKNGLLRPHLLFRPFRRTNKNAFRCISPQQKAFFYVLYDRKMIQFCATHAYRGRVFRLLCK